MDGWFTVCCLAAAILLYRIDRIKTITSLSNFWLRYSIRGRMRPSPYQPHCKAKFTVSNRRTARATSPQTRFLSVAIFGDFCFLSVLRQIYRFPDRIDGISPPMQPGICLSMTRMLFIKEDKQDGARANQYTADQPHEILPCAALHRH